MTPERPETTLEDFRALFALAAERGWQWLVVGGHAVNFWARYFLPKEPELRRFLPFTSKDLDVLGTVVDLYTISQALNSPAKRTQPGEPSPVVGYVVYRTPAGQSTRIEVLYALYGLNLEDVRKGAGEVLSSELGIKLRVPSALGCLKAKTHNAARLPQEKRQDIKHLRIMLLCNRAVLRDAVEAVERGDIAERAAIKLLGALFQFTQTKIAREAAAKYSLNWIEAFPVKELLATTLPRVRSFVQKRFVKVFPTCAQTTP
jgi:hypothetical protein